MNSKIEIRNKDEVEEAAVQWVQICLMHIQYKEQKLDEKRNVKKS